MDRGQNINKRPNIVYVSMDCGTSWVALHQFVDVSHLPSLLHALTRITEYRGR